MGPALSLFRSCGNTVDFLNSPQENLQFTAMYNVSFKAKINAGGARVHKRK